MKRQGERPGWFPAAAGGVLGVGGATVLGLLAGAGAAVVGGLAGVGTGLALHRRATVRGTRRQRALALPFPEKWKDVLSGYDHYVHLPPALVPRFEDDVRIFLLEKRITGVDVTVDDELRVLVAASAVTLSLGWPEFEWDALAEVLLYPQDFDRDYSYENPELSGQTSHWGTVILSAPTLLDSFDDPDDGYHVGLHEFAHLLDMEAAEFRGTPAGLGEAAAARWPELARAEMERMRRGRSVLDDYGADDVVEFFAVAVEGFFETPVDLRRHHRELYDLLAGWFRQDPAAWRAGDHSSQGRQ